MEWLKIIALSGLQIHWYYAGTMPTGLYTIFSAFIGGTMGILLADIIIDIKENKKKK